MVTLMSGPIPRCVRDDVLLRCGAIVTTARSTCPIRTSTVSRTGSKPEAPHPELVPAGQQLRKAEHVLQPCGGDGPDVAHRRAHRLEPDLAIAAPLAVRGHHRADHDAVAVAVVHRERHRVGAVDAERPDPPLQDHAGLRAPGASHAHDREHGQRPPGAAPHSSPDTGFGLAFGEPGRPKRADVERGGRPVGDDLREELSQRGRVHDPVPARSRSPGRDWGSRARGRGWHDWSGDIS